MEKYYHPTIEEFHVGFEFEMKESTMDDPFGSWFSSVFGGLLIKDGGNHMYSTDLKNFIKYIKYEEVRVKCLDKEDIESLGFICEVVECGEDTDYDTLGIKLIGEDAYIGNFYLENDVTKEHNIELYNVCFKVKNKEELKVLMKQLNLIK